MESRNTFIEDAKQLWDLFQTLNTTDDLESYVRTVIDVQGPQGLEKFLNSLGEI